MMIHEITSKVGKYKAKKRIGRGVGSGHGKTSGRGHKGAGSRAGSGGKVGFEGGQMQLFRRVPKRGFSNAQFRVEYEIVNVKALDARFEDGAEVTPDTMAEKGLIRNPKGNVKILGEGELTKKLTVTATKFSKSAEEKITKAGGSATAIEEKSAAEKAAAKRGTAKAAKPENSGAKRDQKAAAETAAPAENDSSDD